MDIKTSCVDYLKDSTILTKYSDKMYRLTLPFVDNNNDFVELYIIKEDFGYRIDDDGETLTNLNFSGVDINSNPIKEAIKIICFNYGIKQDMGIALYLWTSEEHLVQRLIEFVIGIMQISGLKYIPITYSE